MKAVIAVLLVALVGFAQAADFDVASAASNVLGSDAASQLTNEPESAQQAMSQKECLEQCDNTETNPENEANVNDLKREENAVTAEIKAARADVQKSKDCVAKLAELEAELSELKRQKSDLAGESKKTLLENKLDLEQRSSVHVEQMRSTLELKLKELEQAQNEMEEKNELTRLALEATKPETPEPEPIAENQEVVQSALADELNKIHGSMISSLESHNQRVFDMTQNVPGLHDVKKSLKMSESAEGLAAALGQSGEAGQKATEKALEKMGLLIDKGIVTPKQKADQEQALKDTEDANAELNKMSGKLLETSELAKLRSTVNKLKKKLKH